MKKSKMAGEPMPQPVLDAIHVITQYLRDGGWCEAIISDTCGAAFRLSSVYDDLAREYQNSAALSGALSDARDAIASLPDDALGMAADGRYQWPIKAELLSKIDSALGE